MSTSELIAARELIRDQGAVLERYAEGGLSVATVLAISKERVLLSTLSQGLLETGRPQEKWANQIKVGSSILLNEGAIINVSAFTAKGAVATVSKIFNNDSVEITTEGQARLVFSDIECNTGDVVYLDITGRAVAGIVPSDKSRFDVDNPHVSWDSIGGQHEAKREMRNAVEVPLLHSDLFKAYRKKEAKGLLLWGPPGCGKTKIGKATASSLSQRKDGGGFMYIKGAEVLDPYVGVAEATVRSIFERARRYKKETGQSSVVFVDEADAILGRRGSGNNIGMEKTIVPTFLTEMDGIEESGAMVILSTNRPDTLDSAILRDGRIDKKIKVSRPSAQDAQEIFDIYLSGKPLRDNKEELSKNACEALYNSKLGIFSIVFDDKRDCEENFTLANLSSGAMIEGIVERAVSSALQRDIDNKAKKPSGLIVEDLIESVMSTYKQNYVGEHVEALTDFADGREIAKRSRFNVAEAA